MSSTKLPSPLFSVIVCSIDPERLSRTEANIRQTIGPDVFFEFIGIDNKAPGRSLAQVYNEGARKASAPYLLFIHEDAGFESKDWGKEIAAKLAEPDTGVIGFAGSQFMPDAPGGWNVDSRWTVWRLKEYDEPRSLNIDPDSGFTEVVALDGFAMFVRRDVWEEFPFDETHLTGFHCYDVDFTLSVGTRYRNYVSATVDAFHNSKGNFGSAWLLATGKLYSRKWQPRGMLPAFLPSERVKSGVITQKDVAYYAERVYWRYLKALRKNRLPLRGWRSKFMRMPLTGKHPGHLLRLLFHF